MALASLNNQDMISIGTKIGVLLSLIKLKITRTVIFTAFLGYYLAADVASGGLDILNCGIMLFATACVCGGVCTFNHVLEWESDIKMSRTKNRPIPSKMITPLQATMFGSVLVCLGLVIMWQVFSLILALGALATGILYDFIYTPLKRISAWNTTVGALPGALPVLGGSVAAADAITPATLLVFLIVFLWQHPHFYAIAWVYKDDYLKAGYKMISSNDKTGKLTFGSSLICTVLLIFISILLPYYHARLGGYYHIANILLAFWFLNEVFRAYRHTVTRSAHRVITGSVIYLILWISIVITDDLFFS
ncbi:protoheme IX farnesyltransferase [Spirochaetota bacterium]|nr:protoheme IX farnesyltransferase [Spirochaetota bacterium]